MFIALRSVVVLRKSIMSHFTFINSRCLQYNTGLGRCISEHLFKLIPYLSKLVMKYADKMIVVGMKVILYSTFFGFFFGNLPLSILRLAVWGKASHIPNNRYASLYYTDRQNTQMQTEMTRSGMPMTATIADQYVSLSCTAPKRRYQVSNIVNIQFSVTNTSHEAVYLVAPKPEDISHVMRLKDKNDSMYNNDMYIEINKFQVYEEHFEMPRLVRLIPSERYVGDAKPKLAYYTPGAEFSVYLTVFYMKEEKLVEFERQLNALGSKAGADFPASIIKLTSSPIRLSIAP